MKLVERTIDIEADPATVYAHFVDEVCFVRWMAPHAEIDPRPGGRIRWTHASGDSCESVSAITRAPRSRAYFIALSVRLE